MKVSLKSVHEKDIEKYIQMKVKFMKSFVLMALEVGIIDVVCLDYNNETALASFIKNSSVDGRYHNFIVVDGVVVGICDFTEKYSKYLNIDVVYINNLYIEKEHQKKGIGKTVINILLEEYGNIELQCHYENAAHKFYESLGFKREFTQYVLQ